DFTRLHPQLQRRFSVGLDSGLACVGSGVMERVWHGRALIRPFLVLGSLRNILIPGTGHGVPFTIENYPYLDSFARETVTFARTFDIGGRPQRFDATMIYDARRGRVIDYLGTHQHIATELDFAADDRGALVIRSRVHRFLEGPIACRIPELMSGTALVRESYDD